jgi:hypothetical protein
MTDIGTSSWSEIDASNNQTPPAGWPEGMQPSSVNNSARAGMGATKRFWNRINAVKTTAGSSTAYTLSYDVAAASYYDGEIFTFVVNATCGASPTLNINGLGARSLRKWIDSWVALGAGDLTTDQVVTVRYNLANTSFDIISEMSGAGTWTPTDASGAGLAFVNPTGRYRIANGMVFAYFTLTFPSTSDPSAVVFGGLPVTVPNQDYAVQDSLISAGAVVTAALVLRPIKNTATAGIVNTATASNSPNSAWSSTTLHGCIIYPVN